MKIYVIGAGGIGGYLGGLLAKAQNDVTFVDVGENYSALKENGLTVKSVTGNFEIKPVKATDKISDIKDPDLIILAVKTYNFTEIAGDLKRVVNGQTAIITFQNGLDNDNQIKNLIGEVQVYPGIAYVISTRISPGVIEQTAGMRRFIFGDRENPDNPKLKEIQNIWIAAGIDTVISDDITRDIWIKFIFICGFSGMCGMYRKTMGELLINPETRKEYETCVQEAITVAKVCGVNIAENTFEEIMKMADETVPDSKPSLLVDIENNRENEIETLNGTLVRFAHEANIDVPVNEKIYKTIKNINNQ
jgi:2-dehydropantoate 2-reductase